MEVIHFPKQLPLCETAVSVGFFDGVHLGHRFLMDRLVSEAKQRSLASVVVTFVSHPRKVTLSSYQPELITSTQEKLEQLEQTGVDYCYLIDFTKELSSLTARDFMINILVDKLKCRYLLMGYDHKFGSDRIRGVEEYRSLANPLGIEVEMGDAFQIDETHVSSSLIRRALREGAVKGIDRLLGHRFRLSGKVVHGQKMGRKIGFPTANIHLFEQEKVVPLNGVYLVRVYHNDFSRFGMMNIGHRPSLYLQGELTLEIHLFDFDGDLYEEVLEVEFLEYIRSEKVFKSLDELTVQLNEDYRMCRTMIVEYNL